MRNHHYPVVVFLKFWFVPSQVTGSLKSIEIKVWVWVSYIVIHQWFQSTITGVCEKRVESMRRDWALIVGIRQEEMWLSRRISSWVRVWNFILGIKNSIGSELLPSENGVKWVMWESREIINGCGSWYGRLTWNDYLYFNLIYVMCAFCLSHKQIPLVI